MERLYKQLILHILLKIYNRRYFFIYEYLLFYIWAFCKICVSIVERLSSNSVRSPIAEFLNLIHSAVYK